MSDLGALAIGVAIVVAGALILVAALIVTGRKGHRVHLELDVGNRQDRDPDDTPPG